MPPANRAGDQFDTLVVVRHKPVLEDSLKPSRLCRVSGRNGGQFTSGCDHRTPADRRMVLGLQRKPSPFWAQNALPKGVHASSITIALCPVKRGQLHLLFQTGATMTRDGVKGEIADLIESILHEHSTSLRVFRVEAIERV